ncbi:hypothetical protein ABN034_05900 [Actinopolymorpha sp. B11F2]|uniref:hypothetical protein n=1 Tax=Actinopolymorpha sp. B11F2 TaxID=3160862 RepID=UPI0032E445A4
MTVQSLLRKPNLTVRTLSIQASTDDGRTWTPVRLTRRPHGEQVAVVPQPSRPAYVSLRANLVDIHGNRSEQTITRAYAVR